MQTTGLGGGLETSGLGSCFCIRAFGARAFRSCFSWFVLLVVLFVVRAFGFVLLVVLFVVRSFRGSCFWGLVCVFSSML